MKGTQSGLMNFWLCPIFLKNYSKGALNAFKVLGTDYLKPVYEDLEGAVNYDDLKILRLYYLANLSEMP